MIQGTILKKKKATLFKCGFQHMWFHTNYRIYCTPDNHHRNLTHPSNFRFLLHTSNFLLLSESVSADLCSSCIFDLSSGAQQRGKYQSCSFFFFSFLFKECFLFSECMSHRSWPNPLSPRISLSGGIERTSQCHRRPLQSCGDIKCHCMLWSHWCKLFLPHGS